MATEVSPSVLLLGISGPSSSGKTTVARLIRDIVPGTVILHQDDFYLPEEKLPIRHGLRDWDCVEAIDVPRFIATLDHIKQHGTLPKDFESKEDQNEVGESGVKPETIERLREGLRSWLHDNKLLPEDPKSQPNVARKLFIIEGFLLFGSSVQSVREKFDVNVFLRARYDDAKRRREARSGYVTLEGFWEDPPGYVDIIVWPGFVKEHAYMFQDDNVEGNVNEEKVRQLGIQVCPGAGTCNVEQMLFWAIERLKEAMTKKS